MKETLLFAIDAHNMPATSDALAHAANVIRAGGLVAFPTETVYGLGANALSETAVAGIFTAKERPANDPLIVHLADISELAAVAINIPPLAYVLAERFWAGALTLVLPKHPNIPYSVTSGQETVAVRVPSHPIAQALLRASGVPIAAPSANRFSRPSPTTAAHVLADLGGRVDVVLDGGACAIGVESTILDLTHTPPRILRAGGISLETLQAVIPDALLRTYALREQDTAPAPGTLLKHYSPATPLLLFTGDNTERLFARMAQTAHDLNTPAKRAVILLTIPTEYDWGDLWVQTLGNDDSAWAGQLFATLRQLEHHASAILVQAPPQTGLGLAVWDRLWRAAEGRLVHVD